MSGIHIRKITLKDAKYKEVYNLRDSVLRQPIGLSLSDEDLSKDAEDTILVAERDSKVIACVMLQEQGHGIIKLRQMAVVPEMQGRGIGHMLVKVAEDYAKSIAIRRIVLHARVMSKGFYQKMNYTELGEEFEEVGIPHIAMEKEL
jgi:N-acetylglutamate synthase-like GNAT family acetyltransferase